VVEGVASLHTRVRNIFLIALDFWIQRSYIGAVFDRHPLLIENKKLLTKILRLALIPQNDDFDERRGCSLNDNAIETGFMR
jgi:hypothetical protein